MKIGYISRDRSALLVCLKHDEWWSDKAAYHVKQSVQSHKEYIGLLGDKNTQKLLSHFSREIMVTVNLRNPLAKKKSWRNNKDLALKKGLFGLEEKLETETLKAYLKNPQNVKLCTPAAVIEVGNFLTSTTQDWMSNTNQLLLNHVKESSPRWSCGVLDEKEWWYQFQELPRKEKSNADIRIWHGCCPHAVCAPQSCTKFIWSMDHYWYPCFHRSVWICPPQWAQVSYLQASWSLCRPAPVTWAWIGKIG